MKGKLIIKAYIALKPTDDLGRQYGKWTNLLIQHGLDSEAAERVATDFVVLNPHLRTNGIHAEFIPYPKAIYL